MDHIEKVQLLHAETFKNMPNLRMLKLFKSSLWGKSNLILPAVLEGLPNDLKFLHWDYFTQRSLPLDFCPENLVKLEMSHSNLEQLWEEDQVFQALCYIHLQCRIESGLSSQTFLLVS